jgi:DNA-binding CsgD family transcriptional regulator
MMFIPLFHPDEKDGLTRHGLTLITLGDPQADISMTAESLQTLFGFTIAEARVTIGISQGKTPEEISEDMGVSINTVRSQIRQAFEKTGSCRQIGLVRIVTALPRIR